MKYIEVADIRTCGHTEYMEVPCESTGYAPFEFLTGRTVRGPLSLITEAWLTG